MAKKGAATKVGKQKKGKDKDFAGSGVEGEKGSGKEPDHARQEVVTAFVSKLNIELTDPAHVLGVVQLTIKDATEAEVVVAIAEKQKKKNKTDNPPELTIAEKIVRIREILAELELEDFVAVVTAIENETDPDERIVNLIQGKIDFDCEEEDFLAAIRQHQAELAEATKPTDKETAAKAHIEKIVVAIDELDPNNKKDFTESGKPDANVLADILNKKVSAADRDKAWKLHQAQDRPITIDQILKRKRRGGMLI